MNSESIYQAAKDQQIKGRMRRGIFVVIWLMLLVIAFIYLELNFFEFLLGVPELITFFFTNFLPPDFSNFLTNIDDILQMIAFAFVAMIVSTIFSLIMAILMSKSVNKISFIRFIVRMFASLLRNIPTVIWASVLVYIFGIGPIAGIIALIFGLSGFLIKTYADTIDEIAGDTVEALESIGTTTLQKFVHGIWPQFFPAFVNWTLYAFEIGVRASSILGIVGAGGIGILVTTRINLFEYQQAFALVIYIIFVVLIVEWASTSIRRRVR